MDLSNLFLFDILDNNQIKITYNGSKKMDVALSTHVVGNNFISETLNYTFHQTGHWYVPNFNYIGCKYISIYDISKNEMLMYWLLPDTFSLGVDKQNIICLGLNKAGTTSFEKDFSNLGYNFSSTYDSMGEIMSDVYHKNYLSLFSLLDNPRYNAYKDFPFSLPKVYEKIYNYRPNDIFILTLRNNSDEWANSVIKYFGWLMKDAPNNNPKIFNRMVGPFTIRYSNFITPMFKFWDLKDFSNLEEKLKDIYNKHTDDCVNFFESKHNSNFKVVTIPRQGELKMLTDWLGIKNEQHNFSWENKTK